MNFYESNNHKSIKHNSKLAETLSLAEKTKSENPPGVPTPSEKEMSPPQLG